MNNKGFTSVKFLAMIFVLFMVIGEIMCVYRFCKCDFEPSYKAEILYAGTFLVGLGGFTGYIDFGK